MSDRSVSRQGMQVRHRRRAVNGAEARSFRRRRLACLGTGVASLLLILVAFVLQVVEGSWFPVLTTAAAFILQVQNSCRLRRTSVLLHSCTIRAEEEDVDQGLGLFATCMSARCLKGIPHEEDDRSEYQDWPLSPEKSSAG